MATVAHGLTLLDVPSTGEPGRPARLVVRVAGRAGRSIASAAEWLFGTLALVVGLAVLATVPIAQFVCLGYLLEAGGRVARSGRLRDGFVGVRSAARIGGMAIGAGVWLLMLGVLASLARSAAVIDPGGPIAMRWRAGFLVVSALTVLHLVLAAARGGRLRHFLWPFGAIGWLRRVRRKPGSLYGRCRDATLARLASLRLPYYFRLGVLGFVGTMAWLVVPVTLIAAGRSVPVLGLLGALLLGIVVLSLPFVQVHFASEGRFRAFFEHREIRARFRRAPVAFAFGLLLTTAFALPLYLLKIEMIPREAAWLPSLFFLGFTFPARLAVGWSYHRSERREAPSHWAWRVSSRLGMLPIAAVYVLFVYLSQFTAWRGVWSLYEQHAFLIPVPFLGL